MSAEMSFPYIYDPCLGHRDFYRAAHVHSSLAPEHQGGRLTLCSSSAALTTGMNIRTPPGRTGVIGMWGLAVMMRSTSDTSP